MGYLRKYCLAVSLFALLGNVCLWAQNEVPPPKDPWADIPDPVATLGTDAISKADLKAHMLKAIPKHQHRFISKEIILTNGGRMLEQMIEMKILGAEAEANGYRPDPELVRQDIAEQLKSLPSNELEGFKQSLAGRGQTLAGYIEGIAQDKDNQRQAAVGKWMKEKIDPTLRVTDEELKTFYKQKCEIIHAAHILIKPDGHSPEAKAKARKKAEEILAKIRAGGDFNKLAAAESSCPGKPDNPGDLGEFSRGKMVPEFEETAFKLKVGEVSDVVESVFGYHIIKLKGRRQEQQQPFEDVKEILKEQLLANKRQDILLEVLKRKREELNVKILLK